MKIQRAHFKLQLSDVYSTQPFLPGQRPKKRIALWSVGCVGSCPFAVLWLNLIHFQLSTGRRLWREGRADRFLDEPLTVHWGNGKLGTTVPWGVNRKEDVGWSRGCAQWDAEPRRQKGGAWQGCEDQTLQWKALSRTIVEWVSVPFQQE